MARYIEVNALLGEVEACYRWAAGEARKAYRNVLDMICAAGDQDVQEVKHGVWIDTEAYTNHYGHIYECSNCHKEVADDFIVKHTYCLHCGAKMDGKENEK